ncbi:glycosyl hydrolases family 18 domain-containing protein [Phthorimaea operculella]|nr:glycosyl hydrolases family 18 domain-containing protein [Phthorimaea operculella]
MIEMRNPVQSGEHLDLLYQDPTTWLSLLIAVVTLATPALSSQPRVVCYYTNWSVYRPGTARFNPQNINPYLCTHLVYAFGGFTKDNTLKPFDKYQDIEKGGYAKFTGLKTYNKQLKTLLAIGGWNEGSSRFSPMVASRERRKEFVRNAIKFLRQNHFDGLDLDWEYPAFRDGGKPKDREHYAKLVKELREEFERESEKTGKPRLLLTMAVPAGIEYIQKGFDVKTLNQYLDWMNLLTYDYHSAFEPAVNHHAPLYPLEEPNEYSVDNELNIDYTIKYYLENGADRDKLVLGIPTYGRSYTLFNKDATEIGSPADGPGEQGDATREKGYLAYYEICEALKPKQKKKRAVSDDDSEEDEDDSSEEEVDEPWTVVQPNPKAMGPYAYKGNQWVGYDDIDIVRKKAEYVAENGLGGIMFWSIDNDDFRGTCHGKPYPLIEAAKEAYIVKLGSTDNAIVTDRPRSSTVRSSSNRRRNRPRSSTTTTTEKAVAAKSSNKRKSAASSITSTTPSWNIVTPEPPTTPDPGSDFKCTDEGFFPHPRDCKKYFWCLDSGPSNLGIVAHQFTCPSGLFFNKAADSCDFARNFRTTTTTTTTPEPEEEEYEEEAEDSADIDAEDPKVIKELIDLIRKVGGVEQLEKQLGLAESSSTDGAITTTPASIAINKRLYQKVLERTRGKSNKINGNSGPDGGSPLTALYSRRGPQNAGLEPTEDKDKLLKKDRPQYTTINRSRPSTSTTQQPESEEEEEEEEDEDLDDIPVSAPRQTQARVVEVSSLGTTAKPLQYVNIRRARPLSTSDTADDSASRNALFERAETFVTVTETANSLDIASARRENIPEYVTIRRQRPTTEEATTEQYQNPEPEESQETALEREISSPQISSQPQYISIARFRSTTTTSTQAPEENSPEPTTVLAVQISSLLNSPSSEVESSEDDTKTTIEEAPETIPTTTPTTTTTKAPSSAATRRTILRRRGSTTTTQATPSSSTQVSSRNYSFVRARRPVAQPNEIASDSTEDSELTRKIRSTTPDSRETESARTESVQPRRARVRFQQTQQVVDSVPAAASPVSRGRFRPEISRDEILSLTPIDVDIPKESPRFVPRTFGSRSESRFRGRTTVPDKTEDSEVSAATVEIRRPNIIPRGRGRFTPSSTTPALDESEATVSTPSPLRPTFARFSPRPFSRTVSTTEIDDGESETEATPRLPTRLPFGRARVLTSSTSSPTISSLPVQPRRNLFSARQPSTPRPTTPEAEEEIDQNKDDIDLSESIVAEQGHEDSIDAADELPKRRVVIKKHRTPVSSTTESAVSTEAVQISEDGKKRIRVIKRRPSSTQATEEPVTESNENSSPAPQRIRKIIRKKIRPVEDEPEIIAKSIGSLNSAKDVTTEIVGNYGEKSRPVSSTIPTPTEGPVDENKDEINEPVAIEEENINVQEQPKNDKTEQEENKEQNEQSESTNIKKDDESISNTESEPKPEVAIETEVKAIDLSENKEETVSEEPQQEIEEAAPITPSTTTTTVQQSSSTSRGRLPYRPPKRTFTTATESSVPSSSRTFSRKFNPGVYTSPATPVSRIVEVNSKLDKHRLNKKNQTTLIEEGQIMVEKKPTEAKIGEVSRFSLIKIYEDEIPIYLTKLGHVYPVENPPDHLIRIDEARNARALTNFADAPRENLIASESMNEAYRHINKVSDQPKDEPSSKGQIEHINNDDFLKYINDDKKSGKSDEDISFTQWQFVPAAYENEQNKGAKTFEIVTPRGMLTEPSTLPLEALFKTDNPMARKVDQKEAKQPFLVYSASSPKEEAKQASKPESAQKIITFAKGQEFHGGPVTEQATVKSPIDILFQTTQRPLSTIISIISEATSPLIEMLTTALPTTLTTEASTTALTTEATTTETVVEETTTTKSPLDTKRTKFAFPRRPPFKPANVTRPTIVPRPAKKNNTLSGNPKKNSTVTGNLHQKPNKTSTFNAAKTRYTGNRSQNVPVDIRKKTTKVPPKTFTTETPRSTTERRIYVKPFRPNIRPAFVPRRNTTPSTQTTTNT